MPFTFSEGIEYFYFDGLHAAGLSHGIFTRRGGVSPEPWGSLNAGSMVGDSPDRVAENLRRACRALSRDPGGLRLVRQVHGNDVFVASGAAGEPVSFAERLRPETMPGADAIITDSPAVTPAMRFADCVPILLYDPVAGAAGIAHAGWRGTLLDVAGRTLAVMRQQFGTDPADVVAGIGPCICAGHYEVGPEVVAEVEKIFGEGSDEVIVSDDGRTFFDLKAANRMLLAAAGVASVEVADSCTVEEPARWFSHRGESGKTGRFAVLAGLSGG
ncbi:MAG TPA: peptidoglycan editing factor PgeF [Anaerolineales bacterium]|nr:peptidoglycan editing factor PgeF [Anaerolineales bacterium]